MVLEQATEGSIGESEPLFPLFNRCRLPFLSGSGHHLVPPSVDLLNFIADSNYRRHILNQLNRGEGRGRLSRNVFYGQRGELRQRYREGQEDQLSALGLVVNALILWTTRYMNAALNHLHATGADVKKEDLARLSPLSHKHFNMLGRYHFAVPEEVLRGELRPLRMPEEVDEELPIA